MENTQHFLFAFLGFQLLVATIHPMINREYRVIAHYNDFWIGFFTNLLLAMISYPIMLSSGFWGAFCIVFFLLVFPIALMIYQFAIIYMSLHWKSDRIQDQSSQTQRIQKQLL